MINYDKSSQESKGVNLERGLDELRARGENNPKDVRIYHCAKNLLQLRLAVKIDVSSCNKRPKNLKNNVNIVKLSPNVGEMSIMAEKDVVC